MLHLALDPAHHRRPAPALGLAGDGVAGQLRPAGFTLQLLVGPEPGGGELARRGPRPDVAVARPPASGTRCRRVVVWRPRASSSRIPAVVSSSCPARALTRVDL